MNLRASVGLAYLICRILDTVEDAQWLSISEQETAFRLFNQFLTEPLTALSDVSKWQASFPVSINEGERALLMDAAAVFSEFADLEENERSAMLEPILSMSRGMFAYSKRKPITGELRLSNLADVNIYCFFVAGVVGELLTGLVAQDLRPNGLGEVLSLGTHFGLFLQKVNVLKDQWDDEKENRFLVPNREELLTSLKDNAKGAFNYLKSIPTERRDYRLFCAWSLYLGLATIPLLRSSTAREPAAKLSRLSAVALGAKIEFAIGENARLEEMFHRFASDAWPAPEPRAEVATISSNEALRILEQNYSGRMSLETLAHLLCAK